MKLKVAAAAAIAAIALGAASAAHAVTVDISGSVATSGVPSLYEVNFDFLLPSNALAPTLNITFLYVDDRGVLQLNGTDVDATGIFASNGSIGSFNFGSGNAPYTFNGQNARNILVSTGFVIGGNNALRLIVNDTNNGIFGDLVNGPGGPSSTTSYNFRASLNYDLGPTGAVPEPATWAMMIGGFGLVGGLLRRRVAPAAA